MIPLDSLRYHPNSYIASRRSSLPRQGYGGVYERRRNFALTSSPSSGQLREAKTLPRHFSDFAINRHSVSTSPASSIASSTASSTTSGKSAASESVSESSVNPNECQREEVNETKNVERRCIVDDRPPTPPLSLPSVILKWRRREMEERRIIKRLEEAATRIEGEKFRIPSIHFSNLVTELVGMELERDEQSDCEGESDESIDHKAQEDKNVLITNLVNRKNHIRTMLSSEYRDSKRQVSQMRQSFERVSNQAVSRFDRLVSDILCYARLVCHLARQSTRLGREEFLSDTNIHVEEKRRLLNQQLLELPRLRRSLLLRQASLIRICPDSAVSDDLCQKLSSYWSYAVQLCTIESEIILDNEMT